MAADNPGSTPGKSMITLAAYSPPHAARRADGLRFPEHSMRPKLELAKNRNTSDPISTLYFLRD